MGELSLAFVQDWLVDFGGAERCLEAMCLEYPGAPIHTLFYDPSQFENTLIAEKSIHTTFLDKPFLKRHYRAFLALFPYAIEQLEVGEPGVVLSFSHSVAHGVLTPASVTHVCYCHTPARYAWDLYHSSLTLSGLDKGLKSLLARTILHYFRLWDTASAGRVDHWIANSRNVARRIKRVYGREASVVYPPVDVERFSPARKRSGNFLVVGRMVPYKRVDLAVSACTRLGVPLRVVGDGPEMGRLRHLAGPTVVFLGRLSDLQVAREMSRARALLFCGEEDFGITPVEAQAAGTPVIAYGRGGVLETIIPPCGGDWSLATGLFFDTPSVESLVAALKIFEKNEDRFNGARAVERASGFNTERFRREVRRIIEEQWERFNGDH